MSRRYFTKVNLEEMSISELIKYRKDLKHVRLKELYRFKQEAEDEMLRIHEKLQELEKELTHMAAQAQIDREGAANENTLSIH